MIPAVPDYLELPADDIGVAKRFWAAAFGFAFTDFGSEYAAHEGDMFEMGLASGEDRPSAPLPVFRVEDIDGALTAVAVAGGTIVLPVFDFPGGRRFEALDPHGNRFGVYQPGPPPPPDPVTGEKQGLVPDE